jgi:septal ring-binding cell division protein DamX
MRKWDKITASSNWTYIMVVAFIVIVIDLIIGITLAYFFPVTLFFSMPILGTSLSVLGASYFQLKKIG